uniref:G2/mitotic-specific cyclin-B3 n=2 Tax=Onchocerca TaxID=6281 RepID=A0A2K6VYJ7_ONCVO
MIPANSKRNINPTFSDIKNVMPKKNKRTGLADLSNAISTTLHISSKTGENIEKPNKVQPVIRAKSEERKSIRISEAKYEADLESSIHLDLTIWMDPCPEFDYDAKNYGDPFQVPEYAMDIFNYYHYREINFRPFDYLNRHPQLKKIRRAKVIDWFVRCQEDFEVNHEVLYHAVKLFDLYMCVTYNMEQFDYIGAASMIVAAKVDQQGPPLPDDFINLPVTQRTKIINSYERKILTALNCDINFPLSYRFLRRYSRAGGMDMPTLTMARYVLETSLLFYEFISVPDSLMAAAALLLSMRMLRVGDWTTKLIKYSGYKLEHVEPLMWRLNHMMKMRSKVYPACISIEEKYSHPIFYNVADVQLLPDKRPRNEPVGPPVGLGFATVEVV